MSYVIQNNLNKVFKTKLTLKVFFIFNINVSLIINFFLISLTSLLVKSSNIVIVLLNKNFLLFYSGIITFILKTKRNKNKIINSNIYFFLNSLSSSIKMSSYYIVGVRSSHFIYKKNHIFSYILFFNFFILFYKFLVFTPNTKLYFILNLISLSSDTFNNSNYKVFNY